MPQRIASWNPERDVWECDQTDLFSGRSDVFSETWPPSGTWADGTAYALPTSEPHMDGSGCSSLLPTPRAQARETPYAREDYHFNLEEWVGHALTDTLHLLPTLRAAMSQGRNNLIYYQDAPQQNLENALAPLTPNAHGVSTPQPSDDGNASWDDLLLHLLDLE